MLDSEGNCNVENFTIGRENYGNIFFPGVTNVAADALSRLWAPDPNPMSRLS